MKRLFCVIMTFIMCLYPTPEAAKGTQEALPQGWLIYHSYSDYSAMDSRLYLRSPDGSIKEITGDFIHAMNGSFGVSPCDIVFMAIDPKADEWDIYRYDARTDSVTDLTPNSGLRNEDPRFSPDGKSIVFKRGHWDIKTDGFVYDLALLDLAGGDVTYLTNDSHEEAMPCFSRDGKYIYYADYHDGFSEICRLDTADLTTEVIYSEKGVTSYYPVCGEEGVWFTKWHSGDNRNDMIMSYDNISCKPMEFCQPDINCSDPYPVSGDKMIYSSTSDGSYDLYYFNGSSSAAINGVNSEKNELGASFYTLERAESLLAEIQGYILGKSIPAFDPDINGDGIVNTFDTICARQMLS